MNVSYFKKIISSIEYYTKESENELDSAKIAVQCAFRKDKQSLYIQSFERLKSLEIGDDYYNDIYFKYECADTVAPIVIVEMAFRESTRIIYVAGYNEKKVEALYRDLDDKVTAKVKNTSAMFWAVLVIAFTFIFLFAGLIYVGKLADLLSSKVRITAVTILFVFMVFGFFIGLKMFDWIPGFILTNSEVVFYKKFDAELAFVGFISGSIVTAIGILKWLNNVVKKHINPAPPQTKKSQRKSK